MMDELNALNAPKKVVDGLVEVFDGLAQMFAGVSEQLDMLAADAKTEDEPELPVAEQPVLPVTEKKGPAAVHPRKKPVKKTKKVEETAPSATEEAAEVPVVEDPDEAEEAVNSESSESTEGEHPVDDADALPWEEDTGQKEVPSDKTTGKDTSAAKEETQSAVTITKDEITAVIVAKIKKKRDNNEKIGQLLKTYGVQQAIACDLMLSDAMSKKAYELTGLENPNSVSQLKSWLDERGIPMDTLGKKDVAQMIDELDKNGVDAEAMDMLKLRLQMAKSSVKKYQAAERCVCSDGRARGLFQFYGASRTGRYSGRNIQLQNLPQNHISTLDEARELVKLGCFDMVETIYGNTPDVLSQLIRTMLIPKEGCEFIVADFSAIEARVLAWEAGEDWRLEAFLEGKDIYCASASQMFHVPVVKHGINGELRQKGKVAELACGYGGSSGALISMGALQMGLKEEELPEIIDSWREANPKIVQYWWDVEKAATQAFKTGKRQEIGKLAFEFYSGTLWMLLPSGRKLAYLKPRLQPNRFGRMSLTYEGVGQNHKWARQETYSGRLVENATQAIARDILAEAMARMEGYGLNIVGHVHDEVIIEAPKDRYTVDEVCKLMSVNPEWCKDLPLNAAGYKGSYYFKD